MAKSKPQPVTNDDLIRLLTEVRDLALSLYPFTATDGPLDDHLCKALGQVAGLCDKNIENYRRRHLEGEETG